MIRHVPGRALLLLLPVLACAACSPDHTEADLKKCVATATSNYPADGTMTAEQRRDAIGSDARDCMHDAGYRQDTSSEKCMDDVEFIAACYARKRN